MAWRRLIQLVVIVMLFSAPIRAEEKLDRTRAILERNEIAEPKSDFNPEETLPYARALQGLLFCLGVLLVGAHLVKKYKKPSSQSQSPFNIEGRIHLSPKTTITLLSVEGKRVVVASGSDQVSLLPLDSSTDELALLREVQVCERPLQ